VIGSLGDQVRLGVDTGGLGPFGPTRKTLPSRKATEVALAKAAK
jgi:hypothetical protein